MEVDVSKCARAFQGHLLYGRMESKHGDWFLRCVHVYVRVYVRTDIQTACTTLGITAGSCIDQALDNLYFANL